MIIRTVFSFLASVLFVTLSLPVPALAAEQGDREILYWVAPMDANYRRDKPGKSPMGMVMIGHLKKDV